MVLEQLNNQIITCSLCPRLVAWREEVALLKRRAYMDWEYWGKAVPGFGDPKAQVMVVGLAPGAHGSNRTGRMFTGDASGDFLYPALHRAGFANQPQALHENDGLALRDLYITAVCRCVPPGNKPTGTEIANCIPYLQREIELIRPKGFVALGRIAFDQLLGLFSVRDGAIFAHGKAFQLNNTTWLISSYHPSRQNTQTGRLTREMFDQIWVKAKGLLDE